MSNKRISHIFLLCVFGFLILSLGAYSKSVNSMNNRIKNIDKEIKKKNIRIHTINNETTKIKKDLLNLEKEIENIETERKKIEEEISVVKKNINYGEKNLKITDVEHSRKEMEYIAKIIAWDKYSKLYSKELKEKAILKKQYRELLHGDLKRMSHIEKISGNIVQVKEKIEIEKKNLDILKKKLEDNSRKSERKKIERKKLISRLGKEKKIHQSSIHKLKREKIRIAREIERIIKEQAAKAAREAQRKAKAKGVKYSKKVVKISNPEAYRKIGKTMKPIDGNIVVRFKDKKAGIVESNGIEIRGRLGKQVVASKGGKVIYADKFEGLGKVIMIEYGNGIIGVYGNLLALKVRYGSEVKMGQKIGVLGLSSEKKPNLYYELRVNLKPIDPIPSFK